MRHITNEYERETNLIECTPEEFEVLYAFLTKAGVRLRQTQRMHKATGDDVITAQIFNAYSYFLCFSTDDKRVRELAENAIADENWMR